MYYLKDFCFLCLSEHKNLKNILSKDKDGTMAQNILQYLLPEYVFLKSGIPKYICSTCLDFLSEIYKFRLKCLQNAVTLEDYIKNLAPVQSTFQILSITLIDIAHFKVKKLDDINVEVKSEIKTEVVEDEAPEPPNRIETQEKCVDAATGETSKENTDDFLIKKDIYGEFIIKKEEIMIEDVCPNEGFDELVYYEEPHGYDNSNVAAPVIEESDPNLPITNEIINQDKSTENIKTVSRKETVRQEYPCSVCKKIFYRKSDVTRHEKTHTEFKCKICHKIYSSPSELQKHSQNHPVCLICKKAFKTKSKLKIHSKIHQIHKCTLCSLKFKNEESLNEHMTKHKKYTPEQKLFECKVCHSHFINSISLKRHEPVHNLKPFKCTICKRFFKRKEGLTQHKKVHFK